MTYKSAVTEIISWVRVNGEMSEDGTQITYNCDEIEAKLQQALQIEHEQIKNVEFDKLNSGLKVQDPVTYAKYFAKKNSYFKLDK